MGDALLRLFPLGLFLRGIVPGGFFVISFVVATHGWEAFFDGTVQDRLPELILIAIFAGVVVYTLYRSVVYPPIEYVLDAIQERRRNARGWATWFRLISQETIDRMIAHWSLGAKNGNNAVFGSRLAEWGNYIHLQYASALCIILGAIVGWFRNSSVEWDCQLILATAALLVSALVSDLRAMTVFDYIRHEMKPDEESTELPNGETQEQP